jgi:hypothetical protein
MGRTVRYLIPAFITLEPSGEPTVLQASSATL